MIARSPFPDVAIPQSTITDFVFQYAENWPDAFTGDLSTCVECANSENPLYKPARKPRGGSPYGFGWRKMNKIRTTARHLYIFLKHNRKKLPNEQSINISELYRAYGLSNQDTKDPKQAI